MDTDEWVVKLQIYHGGKFLSANKYVGGDVVQEELDIEYYEYFHLVNFIHELGYDDILTSAFREPVNDVRFIYFSDLESFRKEIIGCIDDSRCLKIFVECVGGVKNVEESIGLQVGEKVSGEGPSEEISSQEVSDDDDDVEEGEEELNDEDIDVISEDDEYLEVREILAKQKGKSKEIVTWDFYNNDLSFDNWDLLEVDEEENSDGSIYSDDDDDEKWPGKTYSKDCDHKTLEFELGMRFKDTSECKAAIKLWAIFKGHNITWKRSGKRRLEAVCEEECKLLIYASRKNPRDPTCFIKRFIKPRDPTCRFATRNKQVTSKWVADMYEEKIKRFGHFSAKDIQSDVWLTYGVDVHIRTCYRARKIALSNLRGSLVSHYANLRSYLTELRNKDREGRFELQTFLNAEEKPVFERIYIGFSALRKGFLIGCRRLMGFDACFLKTELGGALLCAVGIDCNFRMFPVAWAVVPKENKENWTWFFKKLFEDLRITCGVGWTFMSDKQKGLINGIHKLAPNAKHRNCARHVYANWRKKWSGKKYKHLFWEVVNSCNKTQFNEKLNQLKANSEKAYEDFMMRQPHAFCKSLFDIHSKSDMNNNNICETFNSYILKARDKHLIHMLEDIRRSLMTRMYEHSIEIESHTDVLCPRVRKRLEKAVRMCRFCALQPAKDRKYEVRVSQDCFVVDLNARECSCKGWEMTGLPCYHVLACINHSRLQYEDFVDDFYKKDNWKATYQYGLVPIEGPKDWPRENCPPILPPMYVKPPGRPKKKRKKDAGELKKTSNHKLAKIGSKMTCSECGNVGHNKRTCTLLTSTTASSTMKVQSTKRKAAAKESKALEKEK